MKRGAYYNEYGEHPAGRSRWRILLHLLDVVITLLTVAMAVLLAATYLVPHINPGRIWFCRFWDLPRRPSMWPRSS